MVWIDTGQNLVFVRFSFQYQKKSPFSRCFCVNAFPVKIYKTKFGFSLAFGGNNMF